MCCLLSCTSAWRRATRGRNFHDRNTMARDYVNVRSDNGPRPAAGGVGSSGGTSVSAGLAPAKPHIDLTVMLRYEPTGLSLLRPFDREKVPVVFVHGLWSNPCSWSPMIESLEADPALHGRYQFWTYGYSTGDPLPYSAMLFRSDLEQVRRKFDPKRRPSRSTTWWLSATAWAACSPR